MTLLDELIRDRVRASIGATLSRATERAAKKFANEMFAAPGFRDRFRQLVERHFASAVTDLDRPHPTRRRRRAGKQPQGRKRR